MSLVTRDIVSSDLERLWLLNEANAPHVSSLSQHVFDALVANAAFAKVAVTDVGIAGMLIGFDENGQYESPNFLWFKARYEKFVYIDRIAVAEGGRRFGVGTALYEKISDFARLSGHSILTCEYNLSPPNPISAAFHAAVGFSEVGQQDTSGGKVTVSLQVKHLGLE